jgi:hypothetical protein
MLNPGQHLPLMVCQEKVCGHMRIPPLGVARNPGLHFDHALDQPVHGPLNFFSPDIELPDHMEEVVGQNPNL